jgi:hypothetical protein
MRMRIALDVLLSISILMLYGCNFTEKTKMEKLLSQTTVKSSKVNIEPLCRPAPSSPSLSQMVVPTAETAKVRCKYISREIMLSDKVDTALWNSAEEVCINLCAKDGVNKGPVTFARFLWTRDHLHFYVEVEQSHPSLKLDFDRVWLGDNIEFLIAPRWFATPFYDEYEFLFNSKGGYTDLHWTNNRTLEEALSWNVKGIELEFHGQLTLHKDISGWAVQGKIPFSSFGTRHPRQNDYWGLGLFRKHYIDDANELLLAWSPPLMDPPKFHTPTRFGAIIFSSDE